jgi:crotonobetainyl-CoA:carnitine CoA-transferase CaiB-like acyl-CoA transferase
MMNIELLSHLKVIEIAQGVSAPMATCRLADLGAQVIKIEIVMVKKCLIKQDLILCIQT